MDSLLHVSEVGLSQIFWFELKYQPSQNWSDMARHLILAVL